MPFVADGIVRVSDSECYRKLVLLQISFDASGVPTLTFTDRVENTVDGVPGNQYDEQLPCPDLTTGDGADFVVAARAYWHAYSDTLGNV